MARNASQKGVDWSQRHAIDLARVEAGQVATVTALLTKLDARISELIIDSDLAPGKEAKLRKLQQAAADAIHGTYKGIAKQQKLALGEVAGMEAKAVGKQLNHQIGADVFGAVLTPKQWSAVANETLIFGHSSGDWWAAQDQALRFKFAGQMQEGYAMGESVPELARRIRGTKAAGFNDGIMQASKREAEALARSSVQTISNAARLKGFEEQGDIIKGIQWVATLDGRTTPICIGLNGLTWSLPDYKPLGHDKVFPGATAHWGCRSTQIAVLRSWAELSGKKIKALDQATLQDRLQDRLKRKGMPADQAAKAMARAKASMDGQVAEQLSHDDWLSAISDEQALNALGPGRYRLWKEGKITVRDLTDQRNRPLTIAQLEAAIEAGDTTPETEGAEFLPEGPIPTDETAAQAAAEAAEKAAAEAEAEAAKAAKAAAAAEKKAAAAERKQKAAEKKLQAIEDADAPLSPAERKKLFGRMINKAGKGEMPTDVELRQLRQLSPQGQKAVIDSFQRQQGINLEFEQWEPDTATPPDRPPPAPPAPDSGTEPPVTLPKPESDQIDIPGYQAWQKKLGHNAPQTVEDVLPYLGTDEERNAMIHAWATGAFYEVNNPTTADQHKVANLMVRTLDSLPDHTSGKPLHRVLGFNEQTDVESFLNSIGKPGEIWTQEKTMSSWTEADPLAPGQTPMNNIGLDVASQFGEETVVLTVEKPRGAKNISWAYGEGLDDRGIELLYTKGTKFTIQAIERMPDGKTHVKLQVK